MDKISPFQLKKNFILGVASASTQIEGGDVKSNWNDWFDRGFIKDGSNPSNANQHYIKFKEDLQLMASMGIKAYRFGIEWARIEPIQGHFDRNVLDHYKEAISYMHDLGIKPLLTLYHFSHPMWFEKLGGFSLLKNVDYFINFVEICIQNFGLLVDEYITINEPNVYAFMGYAEGVWPPGQKSIFKAAYVMSVLAVAHVRAYKLIHSLTDRPNVKVSFAHHVRAYSPKNKFNPWHFVCTAIIRQYFQDSLTKAFFTGSFSWPLKNLEPKLITKGTYIDYIAINYYTRSTVSSLADGVKQDARHNDLGWEIYPEGLAESAQKLYKVLQLPIFITENGTCDNADAFRAHYIAEHIEKIASTDKVKNPVIDLPIERYYHWCFIDNFEWIEGESARFGIVHCNYETQERSIKQSGYFYSELIKNHGLTQSMLDKYINNGAFNASK